MIPGEDPASRLVGQILAGRYRILEKLGEGAMGAVYVGEHLKIGRRDAIKVLRDSQARDPEATARFLRGARNVSTIAHPNVCAIYDFSDTEDGLQFLAMEYISGESLKDVLTRTPRLPVERALHIARQIASALDAAHHAGVIHRDLKPGNIMVTPGRDGRDVVKVVDFDIAKGADGGGDEVTRLGFVVGTPEYMSPEQLMGEQLDGRSDIYALGIILFRMLTGGLPFQGETTQDLMIQRLTNPPLTIAQVRPELDVPERVHALIARALERRPGDRLSSAAEFEKEVASLLTEVNPALRTTASQPGSGTATALPGPSRVERAGAHAAPEEIPATRIAAASPSFQAPPSREVASSGGRRKIAISIAALAGAAVLVFGGRALLLNDGGDAASSSTESGNAGIEEPGPDTTLPVAGVGPTPVQSPGAGEARTAGGDQPPVGADTNAGRGTAVVPTPSIAISPETANDVLFNQLDRLGAPAQSAATLQAVIDTATAIWQSRSMVVKDRALAAYVLGSAYDARSDWPRCANWLDSALVLNPGGAGYIELRDKCRRGGL